MPLRRTERYTTTHRDQRLARGTTFRWGPYRHGPVPRRDALPDRPHTCVPGLCLVLRHRFDDRRLLHLTVIGRGDFVDDDQYFLRFTFGVGDFVDDDQYFLR